MAERPSTGIEEVIARLRKVLPAHEEDLVQEAGLRFLTCPRTARNVTALMLVRIEGLRVDGARREKLHRDTIDALGRRDGVLTSSTPVTTAIREEEAALLRKAVARLGGAMRFVVQARLDGRKTSEIAGDFARLTGKRLSESRVRHLWSEGIERLRCMLDRVVPTKKSGDRPKRGNPGNSSRSRVSAVDPKKIFKKSPHETQSRPAYL